MADKFGFRLAIVTNFQSQLEGPDSSLQIGLKMGKMFPPPTFFTDRPGHVVHKDSVNSNGLDNLCHCSNKSVSDGF